MQNLVFAKPSTTSTALVFGGSANDLLFDQAAPASPHLVFGAGAASAPEWLDITLVGSLPALTALIRMTPPAQVTLVAALPGLALESTLRPSVPLVLAATLPTLSAVMAASYFTHTSRPDIYQAQTSAQAAVAVQAGIDHAAQQASAAATLLPSLYSDASALSALSGATWASALGASLRQSSEFQDGVNQRHGLGSSMADATRQRRGLGTRMQDGVAARALTHASMQDGIRTYTDPLHTGFEDALARTAFRYQGSGSMGDALRIYRGGVFQDARVPPPGQYVRPIIVVPPVHWSTDLLFQCPPLPGVHLLFGPHPCQGAAPQALLYILPARFYMTAHSIYAQRLPDLADIPLFAATVSADSGSYCWSLQASGPASLFNLLAPVDGLPAQLRLMLDGLPWVFAIDSISRTAQFGQTGASVQGRSVTALIGAPYLRSEQRIEPEDKTAQQLALLNLAGTGIDLDWGVGAGALANGGLIDWFVPAGAYSRQGTALEAVNRIVQAAGGYLQSHRSAPTLLARHPYGMRSGDNPGAPWGWMTGPADVELAPDALITEAVQRQDGADINAVYVSGTSHGVLALVKRAGSAADKLAPMVADSLITHVDAARQAGLAILGAAGHKYSVSLELPVLTGVGQPGVLDVGQLVQVNASVPWRGRVRAVSVRANQPSLRQSVTLERHLQAA